MRASHHDGRKRLYLDFDSYFAAVEEQAAPAPHGRPVAVLPYEGARTCVISANAAAKRHGVGTGTGVDEACRRCPGITLIGQRPDLYVRVQRRVANAVNAELPIDAVCSVDELCYVLGARDEAEDVGRRIKARLREAVGPRVTCSMGVASNRWLAKVASAMDKPDGFTVLDALPGRLLALDLEDLPGVGARVRARLRRAGIGTVSALWEARPKALRAVWGSVHGERLWYALHGHDVGPLRTRRGSVGHGRVAAAGGAERGVGAPVGAAAGGEGGARAGSPGGCAWRWSASARAALTGGVGAGARERRPDLPRGAGGLWGALVADGAGDGPRK